MSSSEMIPQLTVACLVRDASVRLRHTLASVASLADEIVVGDCGSTDDTRDVATEFGCRVIGVPWNEDFAAARNALQAEIKGGWILWLEAGETLTAETARELKAFVGESAQEDKAYMLLVKRPAGSEVEGEQVGQIRLYPATAGLQFEGRVRENVTRSLSTRSISAEGLPYRIYRGSWEHDAAWKRSQAERNVRLAQLQIEQEGVTPAMLNTLGEACHALGKTQEARDFYRQALQASESGSADRLEAYYGLLTSMDGDAELSEEQLQTCLAGLQQFPVDAQLLCALGSYLQARGRLDLAARSYETAFRHGQIVPVIWHVDQIREIAALCFSLTLQLQHREPEAEQVLLRALQEHPGNLRLLRQLMELSIKRGDIETAQSHLEQIAQCEAEVENASARDWNALQNVVRAACLANQGKADIAQPLVEAAYNSGCRDPLCLRWTFLVRIALDLYADAAQVLEAWRALDPQAAELQHFQSLLNETATKRAEGMIEGTRYRVDQDGGVTGHGAARNVGSRLL